MNQYQKPSYRFNLVFRPKTHFLIRSKCQNLNQQANLSKAKLEQQISRLEQTIQHYLQSQPIAQIQWRGTLEQAAQTFQPSANFEARDFKQLITRIKRRKTVIALDFGWTNFVVFLCSQGWGIIPNLHPRNSWIKQTQQLKIFRQDVLEQSKITLDSWGDQRLQKLNSQLQIALQQEASFKESVRKAMFNTLESLCAPFKTVITESLDIARLYQQPCKQKAIDDLDWWHLLERVQQITQKQKLVLVSHPYKSLVCPYCQHSNYRNRSGNQFKCLRCGVSPNPDLVALLNFIIEVKN